MATGSNSTASSDSVPVAAASDVPHAAAQRDAVQHTRSSANAPAGLTLDNLLAHTAASSVHTQPSQAIASAQMHAAGWAPDCLGLPGHHRAAPVPAAQHCATLSAQHISSIVPVLQAGRPTVGAIAQATHNGWAPPQLLVRS